MAMMAIEELEGEDGARSPEVFSKASFWGKSAIAKA
jgi:hypothetical protein